MTRRTTAHRHKVGETEEVALAGEEREEAKKREEAARISISGIEAVKRKLGVKTIYDLSATPFFLRGSGYKRGSYSRGSSPISR